MASRDPLVLVCGRDRHDGGRISQPSLTGIGLGDKLRALRVASRDNTA